MAYLEGPSSQTVPLNPKPQTVNSRVLEDLQPYYLGNSVDDRTPALP